MLGIEQHADRDEEQNGEGVPQRQRFFGRAMAERGFPHDHAGEERAESEGDAEERGRAVGDADRRGDDAQREELARAGARHLPEQPREQPPADDQHERDEDRDLPEGERAAPGPVDSRSPATRPVA